MSDEMVDAMTQDFLYKMTIHIFRAPKAVLKKSAFRGFSKDNGRDFIRAVDAYTKIPLKHRKTLAALFMAYAESYADKRAPRKPAPAPSSEREE